VFGVGARLGEVGIVVLDLGVAVAMGKLIGEAVVGFAGMRLRIVFDSALLQVGVVLCGSLGGHDLSAKNMNVKQVDALCPEYAALTALAQARTANVGTDGS
jgi:hypothetical protein